MFVIIDFSHRISNADDKISMDCHIFVVKFQVSKLHTSVSSPWPKQATLLWRSEGTITLKKKKPAYLSVRRCPTIGHTRYNVKQQPIKSGGDATPTRADVTALISATLFLLIDKTSSRSVSFLPPERTGFTSDRHD